MVNNIFYDEIADTILDILIGYDVDNIQYKEHVAYTKKFMQYVPVELENEIKETFIENGKNLCSGSYNALYKYYRNKINDLIKDKL